MMPGQAADQELQDEADREQHRRRAGGFVPPHIVAIRSKYSMPAGTISAVEVSEK